jgi:hypothetical protein
MGVIMNIGIKPLMQVLDVQKGGFQGIKINF